MQRSQDTELVTTLVDIYTHAPYFTEDDEKDLLSSLSYISIGDDEIACILKEIQEKRNKPKATIVSPATTKESSDTQQQKCSISPEVKKKIVAAYFYEPIKPAPQKPFLPENKPKQKARYRDSKIVTLKGEKYV